MKPAKTKRKSEGSNYQLEVHSYSVRIYPGQSSNPPASISGKDLGYVILEGDGTPFVIHFLPDGSGLPQPGYNAGFKFVEMCMNWCQLAGLMTLLEKANSVQAYLSITNGVPWADVEGQFVRQQ
jgi:hypothetical protein